LRNKSTGGVNDCSVRVGAGKHWSQCRLCKSSLLPAKPSQVDAALVIKTENGKRVPNDADGLSADEFDDDRGHAHTLPGETWQAMACRIPKHPVELRVRQATEAVVVRDEKRPARKTHGTSEH
jgi:hypothetical protein